MTPAPLDFAQSRSEGNLIGLGCHGLRFGNQWSGGGLVGGTSSVAARSLTSLRRPDHAVARPITALEVGRLRVALRQSVVPHPTAALRTARLIERERASRRTGESRLDM